MLKIKDNVDLKELEKFGIYQDKEYTNIYEGNEWFFRSKVEEFCKGMWEEREIDYNSHDFNNRDLDTLYDLIKADLVEKVD